MTPHPRSRSRSEEPQAVRGKGVRSPMMMVQLIALVLLMALGVPSPVMGNNSAKRTKELVKTRARNLLGKV